MFGRDLDRMMQMWAELLGEIEGSPMQQSMWERVPDRMKRPKIGTVEDRDEDIVLTADLPDIHLMVCLLKEETMTSDKVSTLNLTQKK